jgi:predicted membrane protein
MATNNKRINSKALFTGGIILALGVIWLLRKMGVYIPHWVYGWEMILIVIGLAIGADNKFRNPASYVLIIIGAVFLLDDLFALPLNIMEYFWPLLVIFVGLMIMIRPRLRKHQRVGDNNPREINGSHEKIDSLSLFTGVKKTIRSQQFTGGETVTVFGGTELNLTQADIDGTAVIECTAIFGGVKLIVPKNWEVRTEATVIFGAVEDKRYTAVEVIPENKVLILGGTVIFGGIDIVSY